MKPSGIYFFVPPVSNGRYIEKAFEHPVEIGLAGKATTILKRYIPESGIVINQSSNNHKKQTRLTSSLYGRVIHIEAHEGQQVNKGDLLLVIESMKMENKILALNESIIEHIKVKRGDHIKTGMDLVTFR